MSLKAVEVKLTKDDLVLMIARERGIPISDVHGEGYCKPIMICNFDETVGLRFYYNEEEDDV